jgi:uncharacterized protein YlzI (FlbEa/FlbD family)
VSDYIKVTSNSGNSLYVNAYRVTGVGQYTGGKCATVIDTIAEQSYVCQEAPEEVIAMLNGIVNGPETGPIKVPNFPGMEK